MSGSSTSVAEVTHVSQHGFRLLLEGDELLVPFAEFPRFRNATIAQLTTVEWPSPDHLNWPLLDVGRSFGSIRNPSAFSLMSRPASEPWHTA